MPLDIVAFVRKWNASQLTERSAAQQHFRDLCEALGVPHPTQEDDIGASYTYEKRVAKTGGGEGFADVWKRGFFAWEYKSKGGDLKAAHKQINEYHEALENPPLLVVCDFVRFEVHTKFENLPSRVYAFTLDDLLVARDTPKSALPPLDVLRYVFGDFNQLRPNVAAARVTEAAARDFLQLAQRLELERAAAPERPAKEQIAHLLMRLVFCLFADSVGLLPNHAFRRLVTNDRFSAKGFNKKLPVLFEAMSNEGGFFGADNIPYFNGGLFSDNSTIDLDVADLGVLFNASQHDWSHIEPAIFGTLFERSLDAAKRSMIGAHYTSTEDILLLIEPVIMDPLRRRWATVKESVLAALEEEKASPRKGAGALQLNRPALHLLQDWATELSRVRILDPACGSGNFLYVALKRLLDLWHEARVFGIEHGLTISLDPMPNPSQLFGIEIDFYAHEIASIVVWIGFLQWKHDHGVKDDKEPLLRKLTNIEHDDAIMRYDEAQKSDEYPGGKPYEPEWRAADYIVGNPPFLGATKMRSELRDIYVDDLQELYLNRVPATADLVTYWFEKSRAALSSLRAQRVGLIATQGIRGGSNRKVLEQIKKTGDIFFAWSDRNWQLEGAVVHVSMIAFDSGKEKTKVLNGKVVQKINSDLTHLTDATQATQLAENDDLCFRADEKGGPFDIEPELANKLLAMKGNVNRRPNSDVVRPWVNAADVTDRRRGMFIIDFYGMDLVTAAKYEAPFETLKARIAEEQNVFARAKKRVAKKRSNWWLHRRPGSEMRAAVSTLSKFIVTARVSKHRFFIWMTSEVLPDNALYVFATESDYLFGVLSSRIHEIWSRAQGTQVREVESGFRYTPESCFVTFPFPWRPRSTPFEGESPVVSSIAVAARQLDRQRNDYLDPRDGEDNPLNDGEAKNRTLTKLYNKRPQWLTNAHCALDEAVFSAYGWPNDLSDQEILARLLALNHERATKQEVKKAQ